MRLADHERRCAEGRHAHLLHRASLLLAHDRERRRHHGRDHRDVGDEPRHEEERAAELGVVPDARLNRNERSRRRADRRSLMVLALAAQDGQRVAHHGRRGVGVVAIQQHLHGHLLAALDPSAQSLRNHDDRAHLVAVHQRADVFLRHSRHQIEVARVDERRHDRAALHRPVLVVDRDADVADVPAERVAEQDQKEGRQEQQDHQGAPVARDLAKLLPTYGQRLPHAASLCSTTSRNTSSSDGSTDDTLLPGTPAPASSAASASAVSEVPARTTA